MEGAFRIHLPSRTSGGLLVFSPSALTPSRGLLGHATGAAVWGGRADDTASMTLRVSKGGIGGELGNRDIP